MKGKVFGIFAIALLISGSASAQIIAQDGFEGPWDFPDTVFADNCGGGGFDEDWFVGKVDWVGDKQFKLDWDEVNKTEGKYSQIANSWINDGNIRDLYLAYQVSGVEQGKTYKFSLDYRYDKDDKDTHIQYTVRDGDRRLSSDVGDIEQYSGHERPDTLFADASTFGDKQFHTLTAEYTHSQSGENCTFLAIVRFWASNLENNWLWLDNFRVEIVESTNVLEWALY
jgi:hypothetical protein